MAKNNDLNENKIAKAYEYFDVTADVGFLAYGNTLNEAYENAGLAMFNVITNTKKVNEKKSFDLVIESEDLVSLLYDYLEELLFLQETEFIFFSNFEVNIEKICGNAECYYSLKGIAIGEDINWNKHDHGSEVKAITFHKMQVKQLINNSFKIQAILDL